MITRIKRWLHSRHPLPIPAEVQLQALGYNKAEARGTLSRARKTLERRHPRREIHVAALLAAVLNTDQESFLRAADTLSSLTGRPLEDTSQLVMRVAAQGKLTTSEIVILSRWGIGSDLIGDMFGMASGHLVMRVSGGDISYQRFVRAVLT